MCEICNEMKWKDIRVLIAAEAIGRYAEHEKDQGADGIGPFVEDAVANFKTVMAKRDQTGMPCSNLSLKIAGDLEKNWHLISPQQKKEIARSFSRVKGPIKPFPITLPKPA